jgi:plasmid stabilization system protein ParE
VADAASHIADIIGAIDVLERNPLISPPARADLRELVIGRRARGYVALYRYVAELDTVFVLAIRDSNCQPSLTVLGAADVRYVRLRPAHATPFAATKTAERR